MKKSKRILSLIAAVVMLITMSVFALPASAAAPAAITDLLAKYEAYDQDLFNSSGVAAIRTAITTLTEIVENYDSLDAATALANAQAADTTAQAAMMKNLVDGAWIPYSQRDTYEIYVKDGVTITDYAIASPTDWLTLVDDTNVAAGKTANRFSGFTFHFTTDIDMNNQPMVPVGYGDEFNGKINGHNHVFKRINLQADSSKHTYIGLVDNVIWGGIENLGIESGTITVTGSAAANVGAFCGNLRGAYLRKCWNAASISVQNATYAAGLVGNCTSNAPKIDACFNVGTITTGNITTKYGIQGYGGSQSYVTNSFAANHSTNYSDALIRYHANYMSSSFQVPCENVYSTGHTIFSWNGTVPTDYTDELAAFEASAKLSADAYTTGEMAWKLNQGYVATGIGDGLPVYYTNGDGKVFFGDADNQTRRITFEGARTDVYYLPANGTYDMNDTFGVNALNSAFITTENAASTIVNGVLTLKNEDITIKIINDCDHANGFAYTAEDGKHTKVCKDACGYKSVEPCTAETYTPDAITAAALADGVKATHTGTCTVCANPFTKECAVEYAAPADQAQEHYWAFSACTCGREDVENTGTAAMAWGDAKADGAINILDGVAILRSTVGLATVNGKNADADADNTVTADDAVLVVRAWLGDADAKALAESVEAKINAENLFEKSAAANGRALLMDGSSAARTDHYIGAAIEAEAGQTLAFGPVRLGQPVLGYAYNEAGTALELINYEKVTVLSTLEEGMVLVSYTVPAGAATVRMNVPSSDAELYMVRLNSAMRKDEYGARMGIDTATVSNPLYNKGVLTVGDSICEAARDVAVGGLKGWASSIYQEFDANVTNSGRSGAALNSETRTANSPLGMIANQIGQHAGTKSFEYILIHGGINDAWDDVEVGAVSASFDPADWDLTSFAGGLEMAIYTAVKDHGNTAAIGYHINFAAPFHSAASDWGNYVATAKAVCEKWGIKYIDIYSMEFDTREYTADYIHPNEEGYDVLGGPICAFMPEMRPVSLDVWQAVQETL